MSYPACLSSRSPTGPAVVLATVLIFVGCSGSPAAPRSSTPTASSSRSASTPLPTLTPPPPIGTPAPIRYTPHVILQGVGRPDDVTFDSQGRLLFSDVFNGTVNRLNPDGSVTLLLHGLAGPEGLVRLADGTLLIAEQQTNRILALPPGAATPIVLRTLPGTPGTGCRAGVDNIAFDPTTQTVIVPDSATGTVYRMTLDGRTLTRLAAGITRPVGAAVDAHGLIYVADECGGAVWRIASAPVAVLPPLGGFGMPDDVAFDPQGNLLVIDLAASVHALVRMNPVSGQRETLASAEFVEPQGLVVDGHGDLFVSDDAANRIVEFTPV
jgi:sugar lactone lactonase YvrE